MQARLGEGQRWMGEYMPVMVNDVIAQLSPERQERIQQRLLALLTDCEEPTPRDVRGTTTPSTPVASPRLEERKM